MKLFDWQRRKYVELLKENEDQFSRLFSTDAKQQNITMQMTLLKELIESYGEEYKRISEVK